MTAPIPQGHANTNYSLDKTFNSEKYLSRHDGTNSTANCSIFAPKLHTRQVSDQICLHSVVAVSY